MYSALTNLVVSDFIRCSFLPFDSDAADMGLGKTYQMCAAMRAHECATLIVTTHSTLGQWRDEVDKVVGRKPTTLLPQNAQELPPVSSSRHVFLTTYDVVRVQASLIDKKKSRRTNVDATRNMLLRQWGRVVLDEAHIVRNQDTERFKAVMWLNATHRWALTGTPINNRMEDLDSLSEWIGVRLVGDEAKQRQYIMRRTMEGLTHRRQQMQNLHLNPIPAPSSSPSSGPAPERPELPEPPVKAPPGLSTRIVRLEFRHDNEIELYSRLISQFDLKSSSSGSSGRLTAGPREDREGESRSESERARGMQGQKEGDQRLEVKLTEAAQHGMGQSCRAMEGVLRLRQVCTHPQLYADGIRAKQMMAAAKGHAHVIDTESLRLATDTPSSTKIDYVADDIARACAADADIKVIVFCEWLQEMCLLDSAIRQRRGGDAGCIKFSGEIKGVMERMSCLQQFNHPGQEPRVMLVQIDTGGIGLNLQIASRVYIMTPSWNPCKELQAISRSFRHGQTRVVECQRVIIAGTIEESLMKMQKSKISELDAVLSRADTTGQPDSEERDAGRKKDGAGAADAAEGGKGGGGWSMLTRRLGFT